MQKDKAENKIDLKRIVRNRCPSCKKGSIYRSTLKVKKLCENCYFDIEKHDAGDGPAFFVMCFTSALITILAIVTDVLFSVSLLFHLILWTPLTIVISVYLLRIMKSLLIHLEYKHNVNNFRK